MQTAAHNEFSSEKTFSTDFHIPKRKANQISSDSNDPKTSIETPLANSYYNYPYNPNTASVYYGNYPQYYSQLGEGNYKYPLPPPPPPGTASVEPIKQSICKTLKDVKEKPKSYKQNIFENTVPDIMDETLPKDLKALFQPLFCKLCTAQLSSNQTAKMHYKSKNHDKKVKKWLVEYSEKTGEPMHKRAKISKEKLTEESEKNSAWFYCDVCDLQLTGRLHAESHYMGKNHQKALLGYKAPAGQGYYDNSGKWVRTKNSKSSKAYDFQNGEDNFGESFRQNNVEEALSESTLSRKKKEAQTSNFHCDICDVNTTCQIQLENHFRGQKHQKKLKQLGLAKYSDSRELTDQSGPASLPDSDLGVYRTPSGDYYCPTCNITLNSEGQFIQHWKSKNHAKKASQKRNSST